MLSTFDADAADEERIPVALREPMTTRIARMDHSNIARAGAMMARAFHDDPLMVHTLPDEAERARLLPEVYVRMVRLGVLAGEVHATANLAGAAVWLPPGMAWSREQIEAAGLNDLPQLLGEQPLARYQEVIGCEARARRRAMSSPYWYLMLLAVEPAHQRRGIGGALIEPMLERAKSEGVPCYLETERERNVAFYLKCGFELIVNGESAGNSGVRFWTFRRMP